LTPLPPSTSLFDEASHAISQYAHHQRVLEAMALRRSLPEVLSRLVEAIEGAATHVSGSVLLLDDTGTRLLHGAAPRLPEVYSRAIHGMMIGPVAGSCGTAAFRAERVIVSDIATDPLWADFRALALPHGLRACWSSPIIDHDGTVLGTFAVYAYEVRVPTAEELRVIDELTALACIALAQSRAEVQLARRETHYRALIESAPSVILSLNGQGRILECNPAAARAFERSPAQLVGHCLLTTCAADAQTRLSEWIVAAQRSATPVMCDAPVLLPDGRIRWMLFSLSCVAEGDDADSTMLLLMGQDITDRVASESETRRLEQQLREKQKMEAVGRLAGGLAHDFNNLLTVVQGNTAIALGAAEYTPDIREGLRQVQRAAVRATRLTRQLLAFSQHEAMQIEVVDLTELAGRVCRLAAPMIDPAIVMQVSLGSALPVRVARATLEDALTSLLLSARDTMPSGGNLTIAVDRREIDDVVAAELGVRPGDYARLSVHDDGPGLDETHRAHAFEPFFALPHTGRDSGIGRATLYALAARLHGTVTLDSDPTDGTTLTLLLPLSRNEWPFPPVGDGPPLPQTGATVMVVEDEDAVRHLMRRVLTEAGYTVITAADGEDAVGLWRRRGDEVDVLLTDVVMPRLTGPELVQRLRADRPDLPVVFCSGYSDVVPPDVLAHDDVTEFLNKPFTLQALCDAVARVDLASRLSMDAPPVVPTASSLT
jgi:PAS domain S-box-containing protein